MASFPASRRADPNACPAHGAAPINAPVGNVRAHGVSVARASDSADCNGGATPDFIVTGSATVLVRGQPFARVTSKMMHKGEIAIGAAMVLVGGPSMGVTLGNPEAGKAACQAAAAGRHPPAGTVYPPDSPAAGRQIAGGTTSQSYNNCAVESTRILINKANGSNISEDELLDDALAHGDASKKDSRYESGGAFESQQKRILERHGVDADLQSQSMDTIIQAAAEGKGVITQHDTATLWGKDAKGNHAVNVTGVTYDAEGNPENIIILDTGRGKCAVEVPCGQFERSLLWSPLWQCVVTKKRVW